MVENNEVLKNEYEDHIDIVESLIKNMIKKMNEEKQSRERDGEIIHYISVATRDEDGYLFG